MRTSRANHDGSTAGCHGRIPLPQPAAEQRWLTLGFGHKGHSKSMKTVRDDRVQPHRPRVGQMRLRDLACPRSKGSYGLRSARGRSRTARQRRPQACAAQRRLDPIEANSAVLSQGRQVVNAGGTRQAAQGWCPKCARITPAITSTTSPTIRVARNNNVFTVAAAMESLNLLHPLGCSAA